MRTEPLPRLPDLQPETAFLAARATSDKDAELRRRVFGAKLFILDFFSLFLYTAGGFARSRAIYEIDL